MKNNSNISKILTFNVRYWTDINNNNTLKKSLSFILRQNADIIFLQEVMVGGIYTIENNNGEKQTIDSRNIINTFDKQGYYCIFCNVVPTWFNGIYGNMFCIQKNIYNNFEYENFVLPKVDKTCLVSGQTIGTQETRCFIVVNSKDLLICGVHLDSCSEKERLVQIKKVIKIIDSPKNINKNKILLGDFNSTDIFNYSSKKKQQDIFQKVYNSKRTFIKNNVISYILDNGYSYKKIKDTITTWSDIQSDYIFVKNSFDTPFNTKILKNNISDHYGVLLNF